MSPKNISIVPTFDEYLFHKNINNEINNLIQLFMKYNFMNAIVPSIAARIL